MEDLYLNKYAILILKHGLNLRKGDVLAINTEEENSGFAHIIAENASKLTGNGVFINYIKNGKVEDTEEAMTEFPINKKPTALLHIPTYKNYESAEKDKEYSSRELQSYRHLAEPISNQIPSIPFATAFLPSDIWDEEDLDSSSSSFLSELFSLEEDEFIEGIDEMSNVLRYEKDKLNRLNLRKGRIYSDEGVDLELEFLSGSSFEVSEEITKDGRFFTPLLYSSEIFRALDKTKTNGYLSITRPILLFGSKLNNLTLKFENGRITEFQAYEENGELFNLFLKQDSNAAIASELVIAETNNASDIEYFALPEWDRMRGTSITIGCARGKGLEDDAIERANDSLVSLSLPIYSPTLVIECEDESGSVYRILEDNIIREDD